VSEYLTTDSVLGVSAVLNVMWLVGKFKERRLAKVYGLVKVSDKVYLVKKGSEHECQ